MGGSLDPAVGIHFLSHHHSYPDNHSPAHNHYCNRRNSHLEDIDRIAQEDTVVEAGGDCSLAEAQVFAQAAQHMTPEELDNNSDRTP